MMVEQTPSPKIEPGSSPASRGPAGAYIEGELGAFYLLALLTGNRAPGLPDARVTRVRFQGVEHGFSLDDLVVSGTGAAGDYILEIQSKRDITFSPGDPVYQDVASQVARSTVGKVPADRHLLAIATQRTSRKISGAYQDVLKWAHGADDAASFFARVSAHGVANKDMRDFVATTRKHLTAGGVADEDQAIWSLLRRMLILEFDFEAAEPIARAYGQALARTALADEDVNRAEGLWSHLVELSIKTATIGGEIDRDALRGDLAKALFRLAGERDYGPARAKLAELARNTLAHIGASIAGVTLTRSEAVAAVDEASESHRVVEIRGAAGVGKSWVLRNVAERVARQAPIIVLDPDTTPAGGWLPFSNALGIPGSAAQFLTDLAASGGAVLFIDGIDMFDDVGRQRTIVELMRTASAIPGFRVIATARATEDSAASWLDQDIVKAFGNAQIVPLGALSDEEVGSLIHQAPALRLLLDASHPAAALARNLYRLSRLLKASSTTELRTEAGMADLWWKSADGAPATEVRAGQRILSRLAETALKGDAGIDHDEDSPSRSHLLRSLTLKEVRRDRLDFYHDVLRDWAIGSYIAEDPSRLSALDLTLPASPRVARGVEFAGRLALETGADSTAWVHLLSRLSPPHAHGSWRRQAMLAILRSEASFDQLEKCSAGLLSQDAALLIELCTTITAADTVATVDLVEMPDGARSALPRSFRTNTTGSATLLLRWVLAHIPEVPIPAIGAVVELVQVQLFLLRHVHALAAQTANMLFTWLRQLDIRDAKVTIPGAGRILGEEVEARQGTVEKLRMNAALLGQFAPDQLKAYLREAAVEGDGYKAKAIRPLSKLIAPVAPAELADLVLSSLVQKPKPRGQISGSTRRTFSFFDTDYLPPSPAQPPFLDLLKADASEGLRLIRTLVAEAIAVKAEGRAPGDDAFTIDLGQGPRLFPWTRSYFWSRDRSNEYSAASGLKALEAWSQQRLDDGAPVDDVLADILGPEGSCAAYLLVAVDVLISHFAVGREAIAPFIADPELLATDFARRTSDQLASSIGRFAYGEEPEGEVKLADLGARPSRSSTLLDCVPCYLRDDSIGNLLRERLGAAVAKLPPFEAHSDLNDACVIARVANNRLQRSHWVEGDNGSLVYQSPADEAKHLAALEKRRVAIANSSEIEARISLALDGGNEHASASTARDALDYAAGGLPDGSDTDVLKTRSTRLISTAMLVARDGDDELLTANEAWVRQVIAIGLEEQSDRIGGPGQALRYNRPAIATLALIHLWSRTRSDTDRDALIKLATRKDRIAATAFSSGLPKVLATDPRVFKAAMRAAFTSMIWRWSSYDDDKAEIARFEADLAAKVGTALAAETAWLHGGAEPAWPAWPVEHPLVSHRSRIRIPGPRSLTDHDDDDTIISPEADETPNIHVDGDAAAAWLAMVHTAATGQFNWRLDVVEAYAEWTSRANGLGLPVDVELDRTPDDWNLHYYALFAEALMDASAESFNSDLKRVTDLPDRSFGDVAQTVIHAADVLYFNNSEHSSARPAMLRARLAERVMALSRWKHAGQPDRLTVDIESGGIVAKILFNTHSPFKPTESYVPAAVFDRIDPLLSSIKPLLAGGPTGYVALCTMNLLLVAPRARHVDFLLDAADAWFGRTRGPALWQSAGIGARVAKWLSAAFVEDPTLLDQTHPARSRIDRVLGNLITAGVAEAHELELKVQAAAAGS